MHGNDYTETGMWNVATTKTCACGRNVAPVQDENHREDVKTAALSVFMARRMGCVSGEAKEGCETRQPIPRGNVYLRFIRTLVKG